MGWLDKFFKESNGTDAPPPSTGFHDLDGHPVAISLQGSDLRAARELVNNAALETASVYGIPPRWLAFEVVTISDDEKAYFQLQVLMNHWDEYLVAHTYAFERAVVKRIREDNINVGRAVRAVLWRMAPDAGCPYDDMPEPQAWSTDAVKKRGLVRDRVNREQYALTTPASGAVVPPTALAGVAMMPVSADDAERAGRSTIPVKYNGLLDDDSFSETRPSSFNGFEPTETISPQALVGTK